MLYFKENILERNGVDDYHEVLRFLNDHYQPVTPSACPLYFVYRFDDAPGLLKNFFDFNEGDEDWMVIVSKKSYHGEYGTPFWIECMDSLHEPDIYDMERFMVIIGKH